MPSKLMQLIVRVIMHASSTWVLRSTHGENYVASLLNSVYSPGKHSTPPILSYLSELISHYLPSKALRSSNTNLLSRPSGITSNFTSRAFSVSAPSTWNSLPTHIRSHDKLSTFKRELKSHLLGSSSPLSPSSHPVPAPQIRLYDFGAI